MQRYCYVDMTYKELAELDRDKTIVFSSISPVETHGPHLPLGTDIFIAENLRDRTINRFEELHSDFNALILPTIPFGAGAIPVAGSLIVNHRAVYRLILDTGKSLSELGFKYWLLTDNHGDPTHEIAIEAASRKLFKKGIHLIAPFNGVFRQMVEGNHELTEKTKLKKGQYGGVNDSHAGTNETSLMLATEPDKIRKDWKNIGSAKKSSMKLLHRILMGISIILKRIGAKDASYDFYFMAHGLSWITDPDMASFQGNPSLASEDAGEVIYKYRVDFAVKLLDDILSGKRNYMKPIGWSVRFLRYVI